MHWRNFAAKCCQARLWYIDLVLKNVWPAWTSPSSRSHDFGAISTGILCPQVKGCIQRVPKSSSVLVQPGCPPQTLNGFSFCLKKKKVSHQPSAVKPVASSKRHILPPQLHEGCPIQQLGADPPQIMLHRLGNIWQWFSFCRLYSRPWLARLWFLKVHN